jgi:hypothetical protein
MKLRTPSRLSSQEVFGSLLMRHEPFFHFATGIPLIHIGQKERTKKKKKLQKDVQNRKRKK